MIQKASWDTGSGRPRAGQWKWNALLVLTLAALVAVLAPPVEASGKQLRVAVEEPFMIDGKVYAPATVTTRFISNFNPTSDLHEVWVGDTCLGMMVARKADAEGVARDNSMLFARNADNQLVLVGLTLRGQPAMSLHRIGTDVTPQHARATDGTFVATNR